MAGPRYHSTPPTLDIDSATFPAQFGTHVLRGKARDLDENLAFVGAVSTSRFSAPLSFQKSTKKR